MDALHKDRQLGINSIGQKIVPIIGTTIYLKLYILSLRGKEVLNQR